MNTTSNQSSTHKNKKKWRKRARRDHTMTYVGLGALAVLAILALIVYRNMPSTSAAEIEGVNAFTALDRGHSTADVNYELAPPPGGIHDPAWQNCGVYTSPVRDENAVHSLEHGAIWITYRPDLTAEELESLQNLSRQNGFRLLSPYPEQDSPIIATAWGYQLELDHADDPRLNDFIEKYEQNPLGPEPGAPCSGGVGAPV